MKLALAALVIAATAIPVEAKPGRYQSRSGWAEEEKCFRKEYREEYVPGTSKNPGYVKKYNKRVQVPCERPRFVPQTTPHYHYEEQHPNVGRHDDNSCAEGTVAGGLLGGALGGVLSKKENWIWSIPTGIVGGAMVGCQVDGG